MKAGMDRKTARKYINAGKLPSEMNKPHTWRTREDPFVDVREVKGHTGIDGKGAIRVAAGEISRTISGRSVTDVPEESQTMESTVRTAKGGIFCAGAQAWGGDADGLYACEGIRGKDRWRGV